MRQYLVGSWANADSYDYSGEMLMGNRNGTCRRAHWNRDGSAAVQNYGDDEPKAKKLSIKDRILPQFKRLQTLRQQMIELEYEYKNTNMSIEDYSLLRNVIVCKIARAEVLYNKAISVQPKPYDEADHLEPELSKEELVCNKVSDHIFHCTHSSWVDEISDTNSLKIPLKRALQILKGVVHFSQKAKSYWNELKEV